MNLKEEYFAVIDAVPPYSFELTLHKPAGWWWSTPDEDFQNGTCWSATRFNSELLGLKLRSTGTTQKPQIQCTIYSKTKMGNSEKPSDNTHVEERLKTEEDLTGFYKLSQKDRILRGVVEDLYGMHTVGLARTVSSLDFSGYPADGSHEKKQPNDGFLNG